MWSTVGQVLQMDKIFDVGNCSGSTNINKPTTVRTMLRTKLIFACEETYKYRYLPNPTDGVFPGNESELSLISRYGHDVHPA
jgi:hypothetical protein